MVRGKWAPSRANRAVDNKLGNRLGNKPGRAVSQVVNSPGNKGADNSPVSSAVLMEALEARDRWGHITGAAMKWVMQLAISARPGRTCVTPTPVWAAKLISS